MDPFNKLILDNKNTIQKLFTINNYHEKLLIQNNFSNSILRYKNYINCEIIRNPLKKYNYNIVFIGRLSKEKNIDLLLHTWKNLNKQKLNIKLFIIGDGKEEFYKNK